ncbi:Heat shock protein HtpX [hydrothermal vent metagenome]|uniref:Heat shock protein HtpX n=1 Tax=hydrothermal vent metagenome TaxID=652676 RepID=A0A3B0UYD4_9ZZZZ
MTLYSSQTANVHRTWLLMAGFLVLVIATGYGVSWYYNSQIILYVAVFFAVFTNFWSYWYSDRAVLYMTQAHPALREQYFDFYTVTENLAITAGIPKPKLYVIDDPAPNAFATGRDREHAVICATTGLLSMMTRSELEGVVAHELSHIKNRDILLMTTAVVLAGFLAIIADIFLRMSFFGGGKSDNEGGNQFTVIIAIVGIILAPIAAQLIQLAISRKREFLADASGALLTRYPEGLASALQKINAYGKPMKKTSHATAHLFIGDPFGAKSTNFIERIFSTHPPVKERVDALLSGTKK